MVTLRRDRVLSIIERGSCGRFASIVMLLVFSLPLSPTVAQRDKSGANQQDLTEPFLGCYELNLGRWWPWGFGGDDPLVTPPKNIQLLPERGTEGFERDGFLIRAVPGMKTAGGRGRPSYWRVDSANRVYLMWNDGFTGVTLKLEKDGKQLHGWAHPHFDSPQFIPHKAHVVAQRISCDSTANSETQ